jgi:hypothetical protein
MKTNAREFARNFSAFKSAAARGIDIEIKDREGLRFVFKLKRPEPESFAAAVSQFKGVVKSGVKKKTLAGYGRTS